MRKGALTLEQITELDREFLFADEVAQVIDSNPQTIRDQARADPRKLGFPVIVQGQHVKIPRRGFLHFMQYGYAVAGEYTKQTSV